MDKEEILKRSREAKEDEGVTYAENKGRRAGVIAFCLVFIVIVVFGLFTGQNNYAPFAMFWAYAAAEAWGRYRITRTRAQLIVVAAGAVASLCWLGCYMLSVIKTLD